MKKYLVKGKNREELLEKVSKHFSAPISDISYEIVKEEKGLFGSVKEIEMRVWLKSEEEKEENIIKKQNEKEKKSVYDIKILKSGIYINVDASVKETEISQTAIVEEIIKAEIKNPDFEQIQNAIFTKRGEYVKIADFDPEYYIDSRVLVALQDNKFQGILEVTTPKRGNPADYDKIMAKLKEIGIIFGIKENLIRKMVIEKIYGHPMAVAEGKRPVPGEDAKIVFLFNTDKTMEIVAKESGDVDFRQLDLIENVTENQVLARKIPATDGEPGMNVLGEIIEALSGKDKKFPKGKGVKESENGEFLLASINGHVVLVNGIVNVNPIFYVNGDVDFSTGNINFMGTVYVKGRVLNGFSIKADGDIIVEGIVEDAFLEATGNITLTNGVIGKENGLGEIRAKGKVTAKFIENNKVKSENSVEVREHILHSHIEAKEKVLVIHGKGKIIGGEVIAGKEISATTIGAPYGTMTYLEVGIFPEYRTQLKNIEQELISLIDLKDKNELELQTLKKQKEEGNFSDKKQEQYLELTKKQFVSLKRIHSLKSEKEKLDTIFREANHGKINVTDKMYSGVIIKIGEHQLITKDVFKYATFHLNEAIREISLLPCELTK